MVTQDDLPTGNLHLAERTYLLLRRDYFYTGPTRPSDENPLLLNVTGYLAIFFVSLLYLGLFYERIGFDVPVLRAFVGVLLELFILCFGLHLVLSLLSGIWRIGWRFTSTES